MCVHRGGVLGAAAQVRLHVLVTGALLGQGFTQHDRAAVTRRLLQGEVLGQLRLGAEGRLLRRAGERKRGDVLRISVDFDSKF